MIENAAVFVGGRRTHKGVNVEFTPEEVTILNRVSGTEMVRYSIVEVAKAGMAWDATGPSGDLVRLVVQQGCGCSGMRPYTSDESYNGLLG